MTVSDYYDLHNAHHNDWLNAAIVILCVTICVGVLGLFLPRAQASISRRDLFADFVMMLVIKFGLISVFLFARQAFSGAEAAWSGGGDARWSFEPLASALPLPPWLALVVYVVVRDLGQWMKHVALHKLPVLWSFHKIHHANTSLSIFADYRLHVVEVALGSLVTLGTLIVTGYPLQYAFIAISLEEGVGMFIHSNLRLHYGRVLSRVVTSPQNHRVHHSRDARHLDASGDAHNFAIVFPVWDVMAGTYFRDIDDHPMATGVVGEEELEHCGLLRRQWIGFRDGAMQALGLLGSARQQSGEATESRVDR